MVKINLNTRIEIWSEVDIQMARDKHIIQIEPGSTPGKYIVEVIDKGERREAIDG